MQEGEFERAIERFATAWKEKPGHAGVLFLYANAVGALKKSGDEAFQGGRADEAGRKWTAALHAMGHPAAKGRNFPFGRADLRGSIDRLTASLLKKALVDYRKGNIEAAIVSWLAVLSYDPSNDEAAKSHRTATTQLENLKKITVPK